MTHEYISFVLKAERNGQVLGQASTILIPLPDLPYWQLLNYIAGHAAAEIARFAAGEVLSSLGRKPP